MKGQDVKFVDDMRRNWMGGETNQTPVKILKDLPSQIRRLINIIDELDNENHLIKEESNG